MSDDETTQEVLAALKAAVPPTRMHTSAEDITASARSRRRRRGLAGLAVSGLAVAVVLTLGLSAHGPGPGTSGTQPGGAKLAAWTVRTSPQGVVTLTLRQLANPATLQAVLAEHGVPATVRAGDFICMESDGHPLPGLSRVVSSPQGRHPIVIHIRPAAMPKDSELLFSITRISGTVRYVGNELIRTGDPVNCLRPPSSTNPPPAQG